MTDTAFLLTGPDCFANNRAQATSGLGNACRDQALICSGDGIAIDPKLRCQLANGRQCLAGTQLLRLHLASYRFKDVVCGLAYSFHIVL